MTPTLESERPSYVTAERPLAALFRARAGGSRKRIAGLEDTAYRMYLPVARTLANTVGRDTDRLSSKQAAELGPRQSGRVLATEYSQWVPSLRPINHRSGDPKAVEDPAKSDMDLLLFHAEITRD